MALSMPIKPVLLLFVVSVWSCDAFVGPGGLMVRNLPAPSFAQSNVNSQALSLAFPLGRQRVGRLQECVRAHSCTRIQQPQLLGSSNGGWSGGRGGWWSRQNLAAGGGDEEAGRKHELVTQGLLAVRGGDIWLSAQGLSQSRRRPAVNTLLGVNVFVYLLQMLTGGWLLEAGAKINGAILLGQYYRLLTPVFLHGGIIHLLCNCLSLNAVGPMVEMFFGTERMVFTYFLAGIGGNMASFYFSPQAMSVGASGAIFGLVGALGVYLMRHKHIYGEKSDRMLSAIGQTCLLNLCIGLLPGSRIDNWGHFGGAVAGALVSFLFGPNLVRDGWRIADRPLIPLF